MRTTAVPDMAHHLWLYNGLPLQPTSSAWIGPQNLAIYHGGPHATPTSWTWTYAPKDHNLCSAQGAVLQSIYNRTIVTAPAAAMSPTLKAWAVATGLATPDQLGLPP